LFFALAMVSLYIPIVLHITSTHQVPTPFLAIVHFISKIFIFGVLLCASVNPVYAQPTFIMTSSGFIPLQTLRHRFIFSKACFYRAQDFLSTIFSPIEEIAAIKDACKCMILMKVAGLVWDNQFQGWVT